MKNIKIVFWLIVVVFLMVFIFQNQDIITAKQSFRLNLIAFDEYHTPELPNAVIYLSCFLIGLFTAFFSGLAERLKNRKIIKNQKAAADLQQEEILALQSKPESSQNIPLEALENNKEIHAPS